MNILDRIIAPVSPTWALKRARDRHLLAAYEAAKPTHSRRNKGDNSGGNTLTEIAGDTLRGQARYLEQNHDICRGVLDVLVNYTVGAKGIGIEPLASGKNGDVHTEFCDELMSLFKDWGRKPETTHQMSWAKTQRMMARAWFRDGEVLSKDVRGVIPTLRHGTLVPYSIELLEIDHLSDLNYPEKGIIQGIEHNAWGQPTYFNLYDGNPNDSYTYAAKTRRVNAELITHLKHTDRLRQARGVTIFASVLNRLNDLKDYEDSERIAAKISAAMAAYIKKGTPDQYINNSDDEDDDGERLFSLGAGMIWDNLQPGEDVGTIQSNRPSQLLLPYRNAMLKAIAAGTGAGSSSISKNYDGTYSAQRQELVEQWIHYAVMSDDFIQQFVEPVFQTFTRMAIASGQIKVPDSIDPLTLFDADYLTPSMPWIDPKKEADGFERLLQLKITSPQKIIRQRGDNPNEVIDQWVDWQSKLKDKQLTVVESNEPAEAGFFTPGENEDEQD